MGKIILYISMCIVLPLGLLCLCLEKRGRRIVLSMIIGALVGLLAYYLSNAIISLEYIDRNLLKRFIAPSIEEILKFFPICIFSMIAKKGKRGSAANAFSVGVGFCIVENIAYLFAYSDTANIFWIIVRCVCTGLMHSITSTIYGIAIFKAENTNKLKCLYVIASLLIGTGYHILFNTLVNIDSLKIIGEIIPILTFIVMFILIRKGDIHDFLFAKDEHDGNKSV